MSITAWWDRQVTAAMSERDAVSLSNDQTSCNIEAGTADVFVKANSGTLVPLVSVDAPGTVPGAAGTTLLVVPRINGKVSMVNTNEGDSSTYEDALSSVLGFTSGSNLADFYQQQVEHYFTERQQIAAESTKLDTENLDRSYRRAALAIKKPSADLDEPQDDPLTAVIRLISRFEGFEVRKPVNTPKGADLIHRIQGIAHASGIRVRPVDLSGNWQEPHAHAFLALDQSTPDGTPVALIPTNKGYTIQRGPLDEPKPLTSADMANINTNGMQFYPTLDRDRPVTSKDVAKLAVRGMRREWLWTAGLAAIAAILGLLTPILPNVVLGSIVPNRDEDLLAQAGIALAAAALAAGVFSFVQYRAMSRISQRAIERVQTAFWDRVLAMPVSFFDKFSSGDLSVRVMAVDAFQQIINVQVIGGILAAIFALVNLGLMFYYDVMLGIAGLLIIIVTIFIGAMAVRTVQKLYWQSINAQLASTSWVIQVLSGISKVRLAGATTRMEGRYLDMVRDQVVAISRMTNVFGKVQGWTLFATSFATALFILLIKLRSGPGGPDVSSATFLALLSAFGASFGALTALTSVLLPIGSAEPIFRLLRPIMDDVPAVTSDKSAPGRLKGDIQFVKVRYRYEKQLPVVLDDLSFHVKPGEMVAITGPSGSGKSTTIRLLLGFDHPDDGQVLFDNRMLSDLDPDLVRQQMGVVVQDGQIMRATVMQNIMGGANFDEGAAWRAAEEAALADDIRAMPMGMHTLVDPTLLSGGQAQRILLARALVRNPSIIIMDEATSALDNVAQAKVTAAMDALGATRIVVAHRLSTIERADRILVIVDGQVVEQGTYAELWAKNGEFAKLARRDVTGSQADAITQQTHLETTGTTSNDSPDSSPPTDASEGAGPTTTDSDAKATKSSATTSSSSHKKTSSSTSHKKTSEPKKQPEPKNKTPDETDKATSQPKKSTPEPKADKNEPGKTTSPSDESDS